jgi:2-dehydro-3-deoxyphosphooctonate aldolase (KDO 8-P synthase)
LGSKSGGDSRFVPYLSRAAVVCGADMIFLEVHENPAKALSDGPNMVRLGELKALLNTLKELNACVRKCER